MACQVDLTFVYPIQISLGCFMCVPLQQRNHSSQIVVLILARIPEVFFSRILQIPKLADLQMDNVSDNASEMPANIPWQLLKEITNDFSEEREIGRGGYGVVYKGVHTNGEEIAVKKFYQRLLDDKQFQNELQKLTILRHPNIVRLVGKSYEERVMCVEHEGKLVCATMIDRAICLEYLDNGSLEKHLCDEYSGLSWHCRYKLIKGICDGLKYLHGRGIFHLDLKPANVLLDKNMVPKIADFNLSRLFSGTRQSHTTSKFIGTRGYMPPEYIEQGKISEKFDVFSLGVIIIGIMTGPKGYSKESDMSSQDFIEQVLENWRNRPQEQLKDKSYLDVFCQQVKICIEIALNCVETDRHKRPSIEDIISKLNESETMIEKSDKIYKRKARLEEIDLRSKVPRTEMRSLGPSYMSREQWLSFDEDNGLVGMDGPRDELVRRLIGSGDEQDKLLQGVCILGVAGIGKTMLATQVYNEIKWRFDRCVFISASKKVDMATLCVTILQQLQETINSNDVQYLIDRVRTNLLDKRFLIVIDGVWSAHIVEEIKAALPENNRGSRIITTSGISDVAESCGKHFSSFIYQMKPLTFEESLGLFRSIIFGSGRSCPVAPEKVDEEIVKACGGIPLALRLIAGALASKPAEMEQWVTLREITKQAGTDHLNVEWMRKIFDISYSDLSCDMKTCLLDLSAFPENHVIRKDRLITRWERGESYFLDLVVRNLVKPVYDEEDVLPIGCKVSGSVHDFITSLSSEENFVKSHAAEDDPLPAIEGLRITGETFPGRELQASGYSINGTTSCNFEWVRHLEAGSVNFIGARQPTYLVTADDVDSLLAIEVQPLDDRKSKGEIVKVYANEQRKIICDPETKEHIKKILSIGHVSYEVLLPVRFLDMWEPAVLAIKREGYSIKRNGQRGVVITEKFQQATAINIPYGRPTEFSIQSADGAEYNIKPAENGPSRDTIVLILRLFRMKAVEEE